MVASVEHWPTNSARSTQKPTSGSPTPIDLPGVLGHVASADAVVFGTDQPAYSLVSLSAIAGAMAPGGLIYDLWDLWPRYASIDLPNNIVFRVFGRSEQTPDSGE